MLKGRLITIVALLISIIMAAMLTVKATAQEVPRMTKEELKEKLQSPDVIILDVRVSKSWKGSDSRIKGAIREEKADFSSWADKYPKDKTLVLYCS